MQLWSFRRVIIWLCASHSYKSTRIINVFFSAHKSYSTTIIRPGLQILFLKVFAQIHSHILTTVKGTSITFFCRLEFVQLHQNQHTVVSLHCVSTLWWQVPNKRHFPRPISEICHFEIALKVIQQVFCNYGGIITWLPFLGKRLNHINSVQGPQPSLLDTALA